MPRWLITYDIARAASRAAVSRRLEKRGRRLQKSVFIVEMAAMGAFRNDLAAFLAEGDSLLILPVCGRCFEEGVYIGRLAPYFVSG